MCPGSTDPFYIVTYYIKWVTTSWTCSINFIVQRMFNGVLIKLLGQRWNKSIASYTEYCYLCSYKKQFVLWTVESRARSNHHCCIQNTNLLFKVTQGCQISFLSLGHEPTKSRDYNHGDYHKKYHLNPFRHTIYTDKALPYIFWGKKSVYGKSVLHRLKYFLYIAFSSYFCNIFLVNKFD